MAINIVTYPGKTRTAKHDAIVYDAALDRSGIFNGCNVEAYTNTLRVSTGYGIIKGRLFEVESDMFTIPLPGSGTVYGALIITLDLNSDPPIVFETISSATPEFNLTKNESANFDNSRYQMLIATYTITTSGIANLVKAAHMLPTDYIGSKDLNDFIEPGVYYLNSLDGYSNIPANVKNGWLTVYDSRYNGRNANSTKQIFYQSGASDTHYASYIRTRTNGVWQSWARVITERDLQQINHNVIFGDPTTDHEQLVSFNSTYRRFGCLVSSAKNAGLYDIGNSEWILRSDKDRTVYIPHKLVVSEFAPSSATVGDANSTGAHQITVVNKYRRGSLSASQNENFGIYDFDKEVWILRNDKSRVTYFSAGRVRFDYAISAPQSIVRGIMTITPSAVNAPAYKDISWSEMAGVPQVVVTPMTSVPEKVSVSVSDVSKTGCRIYITRSDSATATAISFIAIYTF